VLLVRQKHDLDVRIGSTGDVLGGQVDGSDDLQSERRLIKVVAEGKLNAAELI